MLYLSFVRIFHLFLKISHEMFVFFTENNYRFIKLFVLKSKQ